MTITLASLRLHAQHAATVDSTALPPGTTSAAAADAIVNQAGSMFMQCHPWNFRGTSAALLAFVAPITISDGTWTTSSKTLTKASGFTSYTFAKGDIIHITDGTNATAGLYHIASRTSANAIVLNVDIGATDGSTDIDGTISFPYVALPSDFGEIISVRWNGTVGSFHESDIEEVIAARYDGGSNNGPCYRWAIHRPGQTAATAAMGTPRLELDHAPSAADPDAGVATYRKGWTALTSDTDAAEIPNNAMFESLLVEFVRSVSEGYMNRHADSDGILPVISLHDRYNEIITGALFNDCVSIDGLIQTRSGPIRNSAVSMSKRRSMDGDLYSTTTAVS